ncbi:BCCT family transporter [Mycolicibacterium sp. XJ2546]
MSSSESETVENKTEARSASTILKPVFIPASAVILGLVVLVIVFRDQAETLTAELNKTITDGLGWWFVIAVNTFLGFALYFAFSKIGRIKLGRDDEEPEFGVVSWFMMLFSAGMGIGLVFFGVAEPLSNYVAPAEAFGAEPASDQAARESVWVMMLQWGLHPWAIYAMVGLGMAYMSFRRGRPLAVRWLLEPLIGRQRVEGWIGHAIDAVAIIGTLFGVATSFGFGVSQIIAGLEYLGWMQKSNTLIIGVIVFVTAIATLSVLSGVHKGLKWLSNFNMGLAALMAAILFIVGPTIFLLKGIPENFGGYLRMLPTTAFHTGPYATDGWEALWPIAYWGWWTSWAPFVGMFIARISRGRTIRQFIAGVLLAPTLVSLVWFTIFGNTGVWLQRRDGNIATPDGEGGWALDTTTALFQTFEAFPLATLLSVIAMLVVLFFFVTSSDSGSLVIDMLASGGATDTSPITRVYWAVLEGVVAAVLLVVGGSAALTALQTLSISTAAPFSVILLLACLAMLRAFRYEVANMQGYIQITNGSVSSDTDTVAGALPDGRAQPEERIRRRMFKGLSGVSSTYIGLPPIATPGAEPAPPETQILTVRHLRPGDVTFHPATGEPVGVDSVDDPIAGEVFDTPEFESSQEYLNHLNENGETPPVEHSADGVDV